MSLAMVPGEVFFEWPCGECGHRLGDHDTSGVCFSTGPKCPCINIKTSYFGGSPYLSKPVWPKVEGKLYGKEAAAEVPSLPPPSNRDCPMCHTYLTWQDRVCWRCIAWGLP